MVVGSEIFVAVFATMKVSYFVGEMFSKATDEESEVFFVERVIVRDIMSLCELLERALGFVAICESDEAVSLFVDMQTCFVDDSNCPHKSAVKPAAKALATGNFHFS